MSRANKESAALIVYISNYLPGVSLDSIARDSDDKPTDKIILRFKDEDSVKKTKAFLIDKLTEQKLTSTVEETWQGDVGNSEYSFVIIDIDGARALLKLAQKDIEDIKKHFLKWAADRPKNSSYMHFAQNGLFDKSSISRLILEYLVSPEYAQESAQKSTREEFSQVSRIILAYQRLLPFVKTKEDKPKAKDDKDKVTKKPEGVVVQKSAGPGSQR